MENGAKVSSLIDNLFGCDPLFVNPSTDSDTADFRLQNNSSAINSGTDAYGAASLDLEGNQRVIRVIDRGAYESSSTADPWPCGEPTNQVMVHSPPAAIPPAGPLDITVDYVTDGDGNLLAILFDANWEWISTGMVSISKGSGTKVINVPISSDLKKETHPIIISLRDLNDNEKASFSTSVDIVSGGSAPVAQITSPENGTIFTTEDEIVFAGAGSDSEDGELSGASLVWSSNVDGEIGTGESFISDALSAGTHQITLTASDVQGATGTTIMEITVNNPGQCVTADNLDHIAQGRAYNCGIFDAHACAVGSGLDLGWAHRYYSQTSSIQETSDSHWEKVDSCP
jgi:hypothetical protein